MTLTKRGKMENDELIKLKKATVSSLQAINVFAYQLDKADRRLNSYIISCINNPEAHNLYELLAIRRFFRLLDMYDFRIGEVKKFVVFYESLKFSGTKGKTRYKLTPIQVFQFANIVGFYKPGTDKRLIREALLFVPRKFSKTTSVASLSIYDLLFGDANAQTYVAANSYNQAKVCFDEIRNILKALDPKLKRFTINREIIYNRIKGKTSFARCLASNPDKLDGLNASMVIVDEYSQADSASLKNVLTSSMGARLNPLTVVITTASDKQTAPFVEMLKMYKAVLRGEIENDSIFAHIFEPDVNDEEGDPATWRKVQPHMGITVYEDFYTDAYQKALFSAPDALEFRTKLLNIFAQNSDKIWLKAQEIEALAKDVKLDNLANRPPCMVAVDLSVCDDFSAVTYTLYSSESRSFHSHTDYYFPREALAEHPNRELYKSWAEKGFLILCDGNVIDYKLIVSDILRRNKSLKILGIGYDPYKSAEFVNMLSSSGAKNILFPVKQTYGTFTSPVESFELAVKRKLVSFNPNPINWYCFANAVLDEDRNENKKPIKKTHNLKIDGVITNLMTFYLFNNITR
ncbi:MAG: terminase large subunit [Bacteroides xylanisolvens]